MKKFVRTRGAEPPPTAPHPPAQNGRPNGLANGGGGGARRGDHHSSLSSLRCSAAAGGAGAAGAAAGGGGALWEDPEFPASGRALGRHCCRQRLHWMRPHELCGRPTFLGDEPDDADDVDAFADSWRAEVGELGDEFLCQAVAALAHTPRLLARVAPPRAAAYCGRVSFWFWAWSGWREVTVDDRLPTRGGRLLASRTARLDDFTLPLLEKAYAKLYGSYEALRAGSLSRALQDLSGGIVQSFALDAAPRALALQVLAAAAPRSTLLVAAARGARGARGARAALVQGVARAHGPDDEPRVALRQPPAGLCWLPLASFVSLFAVLVLVHVGPDDWLREPALRARRPWRAVLARRRWRRGHNAGGPPSAAATTGANPMFHVSVPAVGAAAGAGSRCHVVVSVTQQYAPRGRRLLPVGFAVYRLDDDAPARPDLARLRPLDVTHESRAREVATFFTLPGGRYLVVPHAGRVGLDAGFLLRVFTDDRADVWEANEDNAVVRDVWTEFLDGGRTIPAEVYASVGRLLAKLPDEEVDAAALRGVVRRLARRWRGVRGGRALCGALVALRDGALRGRLPARELPALLALLLHWRAAWRQEAGGAARCPALRLRPLLRAAGLAASNKVLECLVLRFAQGDSISAEAFVVALARLHLAHERYRCLDMKLKSNPLSLEEMILMTIYS